MKKIMTFAACALVATATFAQEQGKDSVKENASNSVVQEVLSQPDGVSLVRNERDGSLQIFSRGTASYDFGDARDIRTKTKVAELKAKAALSKWLAERVTTGESHAEGEDQLAKTVLTQTKDGKIKQKTVSRDIMESVRETVSVHSTAILSGVVTLKTVKIPTDDSSGEIQVTLGISTKTLAAATEAHNMITDSFNARQAIGEKASEPKKPNQNKKNGTDGAGNQSKPEVRINDTLF